MKSGSGGSQAPTLGRLRRILGPFYFNGIFWYRFQAWAMGWMPLYLVIPMARLFSVGFFLALHSVRRALRANHKLVDPSAGWWSLTWRAYRTVHVFSWCLGDRYKQFHPNPNFEFSYEGRHHWESARDSGRGVIVVTSHIGGWEIGSVVPAAAEEQAVIHVVREREADPEAQAFIEELLESHGGSGYRTHFAADDQDLGMELYAALREGEVVALQGDRPRRGGHVVSVTLFGQRACLPPGPAQLARLAEVPLLPVFTFFEGPGRYRIKFSEPIRVPRTADRLADVQQATQVLASVIEGAIREHPEQWFCFAPLVPYEGEESSPTKVESSPSATRSPEELETSKR